MKILAKLTVLFGMAAGTLAADVIDMAPPAIPPRLTVGISQAGDLNIMFDVFQTFSITSAGFFFEPAGNEQFLGLRIYAVNSGPGLGVRGPLLGSADVAVSDTGLGFYQVPISFTFDIGANPELRFDLAFVSDESNGWQIASNIQYYPFSNANNQTYEFGNLNGELIRVLESGSDTTGDGGFGYGVLPHVELITGSAAMVPEPGTDFLVGGLLCAVGCGQLLRRRGQAVRLRDFRSQLSVAPCRGRLPG